MEKHEIYKWVAILLFSTAAGTWRALADPKLRDLRTIVGAIGMAAFNGSAFVAIAETYWEGLKNPVNAIGVAVTVSMSGKSAWVFIQSFIDARTKIDGSKN